ncbi:PREDICTED: glutathione S-transferase-like [Ceratosolen solmsi marchali]|uniref:glutathione transferase n=1 Tax=Ceratosolen solmsi marchali TaxID=326594 RepID=A0AAJ7DXE8_9HYME|nr:PREDICTED: glutathione S-transferase-like [Ceratosolen solmsi marchali]
MANYKLYYFNVTGLAEPIRYILHYCGIKFDDIRFNDFEEWKVKYKKEMPMEQVPVLEIDGVRYHQHKSICRYIGRKFKLCGSNEEESLKIDALVDDIDDIRIDFVGRHLLRWHM